MTAESAQKTKKAPKGKDKEEAEKEIVRYVHGGRFLAPVAR